MANQSDELLELLGNPETTIDKILEHPSLNGALRCSSDKLLEFIRKPESMTRLVDLVLTDEHIGNVKLARSAINVLAPQSMALQTLLRSNTILIARLHDFCTRKCSNPKSTGYFSRIMETLVKGSHGLILQHFPELSEFLMDNISDIALRDLFVNLCADFPQKFHLSSELLIHLIDKINNENGFYVVSALRKFALSKIPMPDETKVILDSEEYIDKLFQIVMKPEASPLICTLTFRLLLLLSSFDKFKNVVDKYRDQYQYKEDCSLPFSIKVLGKIDQNLILKLFDKESCTSLISAIYEAFLKKNPEEMWTIIQGTNLLEKIKEYINSLSEHKGEGHIIDLAISIGKQFPDKVGADFTSLVDNTLIPRLKQREEMYGGNINLSDDDTFDDDDDFLSKDIDDDIDFGRNGSYGEDDSYDDSDDVDSYDGGNENDYSNEEVTANTHEDKNSSDDSLDNVLIQEKPDSTTTAKDSENNEPEQKENIKPDTDLNESNNSPKPANNIEEEDFQLG